MRCGREGSGGGPGLARAQGRSEGGSEGEEEDTRENSDFFSFLVFNPTEAEALE